MREKARKKEMEEVSEREGEILREKRDRQRQLEREKEREEVIEREDGRNMRVLGDDSVREHLAGG